MRQKLILLPILCLLVGCASLYTNVVTITDVVDAGMKDWAKLSKAGKTSTAIDAQVIVAHDKYRQACGIAANALESYKNGGSPSAYINAMKAVRDSVDGLFELIYPLLPPSEVQSLQSDLEKARTL